MTKLEERYARWRQTDASQEVFNQILGKARQAANGGMRFGVKFFAEFVRWERWMRGERTEKYNVNNSYTSLIARELVKVDPTLKPFFETRKLGHERDTVPKEWLKQVNAPRRIPTLKRPRAA
jgi:hypothetical protein